MDGFDRHILHFVLAWAPYAGPADDEVFTEFGITAEELNLRFVKIVDQEIRHAPLLARSDRLLVSRAWAYAQRHR
jgi:hypothetical protein